MHDLGYFVVGELVEGVENECCALFLFKEPDGVVQLSVALLLDDVLFDGRLVGGGQWKLVDSACEETFAMFDFLADGVEGDAVDEGAQFGLVAETRECGIEFNEHLLCELFDIDVGSAEFVAEVCHDVLVLVDNLGVAVDVTVEDVAYYLFLVVHSVETVIMYLFYGKTCRRCKFLFVFEFFYLASVAFRGAANAAVAFLECILSYHLYALVFFLWCEVGEVVGDEGRPDPVVQDFLNLHHFVELVDGDLVGLPYFDFVGRFEWLFAHADMSTATGFSSKAARLVETHSPEVFVNTSSHCQNRKT